MAYYRPGDRLGGYPIGAELGEDGPIGIGGIGRGTRLAGGYIPQGYGVPSYEYERERPLGGAYVGGAPEYYGAERPGGYGFEREGYGRDGFGREGYGRDGFGREGYGRDGFGREGYGRDGFGREGYGRDGFGREGYGREDYGREGLVREGYIPRAYEDGYPRQPQVYGQPPVEYVEAQPSDLGMGLRDAGKVARHHPSDYGDVYGRPEVGGFGRQEAGGFGRPEVGGYGGAPGYGTAPYGDDKVRQLEKELESERRQKHELEVAAAGAVGYGLHERRGKKDSEDFDELEPKKEKRHFHFFSRD